MLRLLGGGILLLALLLPARGQDAGSRFLVGTPVQVRNQPIDVSRALRPTGSVARSMNLNSQKSSIHNFSFSNLFNNNRSLGTWPSTPPQTSVLPQNKNVFQPTPPKGGINLFDPPKKSPNKGSGSSAISNILKTGK